MQVFNTHIFNRTISHGVKKPRENYVKPPMKQKWLFDDFCHYIEASWKIIERYVDESSIPKTTTHTIAMYLRYLQKAYGMGKTPQFYCGFKITKTKSNLYPTKRKNRVQSKKIYSRQKFIFFVDCTPQFVEVARTDRRI